MKDLEAELELAATELAFWRDFAQWWVDKKGRQENSRIKDAVDRAEAANLARKILFEEHVNAAQKLALQ